MTPTITSHTTNAGLVLKTDAAPVEVYAERGQVYLLNMNIESDEQPLAGRVAEIRARLTAAIALLDDPRVRMLTGEA